MGGMFRRAVIVVACGLLVAPDLAVATDYVLPESLDPLASDEATTTGRPVPTMGPVRFLGCTTGGLVGGAMIGGAVGAVVGVIADAIRYDEPATTARMTTPADNPLFADGEGGGTLRVVLVRGSF